MKPMEGFKIKQFWGPFPLPAKAAAPNPVLPSTLGRGRWGNPDGAS